MQSLSFRLPPAAVQRAARELLDAGALTCPKKERADESTTVAAGGAKRVDATLDVAWLDWFSARSFWQGLMRTRIGIFFLKGTGSSFVWIRIRGPYHNKSVGPRQVCKTSRWGSDTSNNEPHG